MDASLAEFGGEPFVMRAMGVRMSRWGKLLLVAVAALAGGCFGPAGGRSDDYAARTSSVAPCLSPEDADRLAEQAIELINLERSLYDLAPVSAHSSLKRIADDHACRMIEDGFFGHRDPATGRGPGERAVVGRYRFRAVGENLASGPTSAAEVVRLWMQSPSHRSVILDPRWVDLGMAVRANDEGTYYWVQEFGEPVE